MQNEATDIANRVRGLIAERRLSQDWIVGILGLSRGSVSARMNGSVAFTGVELLKLARAFEVDIATLYPSPERAA